MRSVSPSTVMLSICSVPESSGNSSTPIPALPISTSACSFPGSVMLASVKAMPRVGKIDRSTVPATSSVAPVCSLMASAASATTRSLSRISGTSRKAATTRTSSVARMMRAIRGIAISWRATCTA